MSTKQLRVALRGLGLSVNGKKPAMAKRLKETREAATSKSATLALSLAGEFFNAPKFTGAWLGWEFKLGPKGVGYYVSRSLCYQVQEVEGVKAFQEQCQAYGASEQPSEQRSALTKAMGRQWLVRERKKKARKTNKGAAWWQHENSKKRLWGEGDFYEYNSSNGIPCYAIRRMERRRRLGKRRAPKRAKGVARRPGSCLGGVTSMGLLLPSSSFATGRLMLDASKLAHVSSAEPALLDNDMNHSAVLHKACMLLCLGTAVCLLVCSALMPLKLLLVCFVFIRAGTLRGVVGQLGGSSIMRLCCPNFVTAVFFISNTEMASGMMPSSGVPTTGGGIDLRNLFSGYQVLAAAALTGAAAVAVAGADLCDSRDSGATALAADPERASGDESASEDEDAGNASSDEECPVGVDEFGEFDAPAEERDGGAADDEGHGDGDERGYVSPGYAAGDRENDDADDMSSDDEGGYCWSPQKKQKSDEEMSTKRPGGGRKPGSKAKT